MSQQMVECARCHRRRYESRMKAVHSHGVGFSVCLARTSCAVAKRGNR